LNEERDADELKMILAFDPCLAKQKFNRQFQTLMVSDKGRGALFKTNSKKKIVKD
jgi:hypothetical protein